MLVPLSWSFGDTLCDIAFRLLRWIRRLPRYWFRSFSVAYGICICAEYTFLDTTSAYFHLLGHILYLMLGTVHLDELLLVLLGEVLYESFLNKCWAAAGSKSTKLMLLFYNFKFLFLILAYRRITPSLFLLLQAEVEDKKHLKW